MGAGALRVPVDVQKLKEMNKQFLRNYMQNNRNLQGPSDAKMQLNVTSRLFWNVRRASRRPRIE